jgi:peptidyl-Lys metalloendopeptidase
MKRTAETRQQHIPYLAAAAISVLTVACAGTGGDAAISGKDGSGSVASVTLSLTAAEGQSGVVHYALKNASSQSVHVLRWKTPLDAHPDMLFGVEQNGKQARYRLEHNQRGAPGPDAYIELAPGQELAADVALQPLYELNQGGKFEVRSLVAPRTLVVEAGKLGVNTDARLSLEIAKTAAMHDDRVVAGVQKLTFSGCSDEQTNIIVNDIIWIAYKSDLILNNYDASSPHNQYWFGAGSFLDVDIQTSIIRGLQRAAASQNLSIRCNPSDPSCEGTGYLARAQGTDDEPSILVCSEFWNISPDEAADSQLETLVHELSHFMDTSDNHYGVDACRETALTSPDDASSNADNFGYFYVCQPGICGE